MQVRGDGGLVVIIELIQVLLWDVSLSHIGGRSGEHGTGRRANAVEPYVPLFRRIQSQVELDTIRSSFHTTMSTVALIISVMCARK